MRKFKVLASLAALSLVFSCYQPKPNEAAAVGTETGTLSGGTLTSINGNAQVCNASASQDAVNFPDCMRFLNFQGK
ncbi:MAG: hypothetical protein JNL74_08650, partial [Fibrobacteres bacterium]|nr:hypothetical protein [Fibrobacterota bacterium]